jgi:hypothetical protein
MAGHESADQELAGRFEQHRGHLGAVACVVVDDLYAA